MKGLNMKLTRRERYELINVRNAPEDYQFDVDVINKFEKEGLVGVLRCADGNYASITRKGLETLKGGDA